MSFLELKYIYRWPLDSLGNYLLIDCSVILGLLLYFTGLKTEIYIGGWIPWTFICELIAVLSLRLYIQGIEPSISTSYIQAIQQSNVKVNH